MKIHESLLAAGLTDTGSKIYESILTSGVISTTGIATQTRIKRTTIYQYLDELLQKGFIRKTIKGKRTHYVPESPQKILLEIDRRRKEFTASVDAMQGLYVAATHQPTVKYYEGTEGLVRVFLEVSDSYAPIYGFFSPEKLFEYIDRKTQRKFLEKIAKKDNVLKDLVENNSEGRTFVAKRRKYVEKHRQAKLLPRDFIVSVDILITKDTVTMLSLDYPMGVVIESKEIADFHRSIHKHLWKTLK